MKVVAILTVVVLAVVYIVIGGFGFAMSAFCFDAGTEPEAWQCFAFINLITMLPSAFCIVSGIVLLIMRRYKLAIGIAAVPAMIAAGFLVVVFLGNARSLF
jgi:hypothetical protein